MPVFKITDPQSGHTLKLTGDSAPTEAELEEIFASQSDAALAIGDPMGALALPGEVSPKAEPLIDIGAPAIGGAIGALAGGGIPGGALGAAGGTAFGQLLKRFLGMEAPKTSAEAAKEIALSGITDLAAGKAIQVGGKLLGKVLPKPREFIKSVGPLQREAIETLKPKGATLTLAQATESNAFDVMENIAEKSLIGGGRITATKAKAQTVARELMDEFAESFGNTIQRAEIKTVLTDTVKNKQKIWSKAGNALYKNLDDAITDRTQTIITKVPKASSILDEQGRPFIIQETEKGIKYLDRIDVGDLKKQALAISKRIPKGTGASTRMIKNTPDLATFGEAADLRSFLFAEADAPITKQHGRNIVGAVTGLAQKTDDLMRAKGAELPAEVLPLWDQARAFWKQGSKTFNNRMVQKIARDDAEGLVDTLLRSGEPTEIRAVRNAIGDVEAWANVQGRMLQQFMKPDVETGLITGRTILKELQKKGGIGKDVLKEFFPKGEIKQFEKLARVLATTQRGQPTGIGGMAIQLTQGGTVVKAAATGVIDRVGATILMSPAAFARVFTNPTMVDLITKGSKVYRTGIEATKFMTRLSAQMSKMGVEHEITRDKDEPSFFESLLRGRNKSAGRLPEVKETLQPNLQNALGGFKVANQ